MALSGRREAAEAIQERIGPAARYSTFVPPRFTRSDGPLPKQQWPWLRWLWIAALLDLAVGLVLASRVALGF
jgi:hypothetical protein